MTAGRGEPAASLASPDERELVLRVRSGDTEAFDALVSSYVRRARAIARRLMGNADEADDLVQDAFLRALQRIDTFDVSRPFGPWFFRLLVNLGLDQHRRRRAPEVELDEVAIASSTPTPDRDAEGAEIRVQLQAALDTLPPRQRLVVWSFEVDGREISEIAATLGLSPVTVRWHLSEGRKALRSRLGHLLG